MVACLGRSCDGLVRSVFPSSPVRLQPIFGNGATGPETKPRRTRRVVPVVLLIGCGDGEDAAECRPAAFAQVDAKGTWAVSLEIHNVAHETETTEPDEHADEDAEVEAARAKNNCRYRSHPAGLPIGVWPRDLRGKPCRWYYPTQLSPPGVVLSPRRISFFLGVGIACLPEAIWWQWWALCANRPSLPCCGSVRAVNPRTKSVVACLLLYLVVLVAVVITGDSGLLVAVLLASAGSLCVLGLLNQWRSHIEQREARRGYR